MPPQSKIGMTLADFQDRLQEVIPSSPDHIELNDRLEDLIPSHERRRVWRELQRSGLTLPRLALSWRVFWISTAMIAAPLVLLALAMRTASLIVSLIEFSFLAYRFTRRWAVYPPPSCQTVRDAVLYLTPFHFVDYKAGLWSRKDLADKVRSIVANAHGLRLEDVHNDTCMACGTVRRSDRHRCGF
jgi:hypothetical protein